MLKIIVSVSLAEYLISSVSSVLKPLPEKFTNVKPSYLQAKVPMTNFKGDGTANAFGDYSLAQLSSISDNLWLHHVKKEYSSSPWTAFYASNADEIPHAHISSLFPVWSPLL